MRLTKKHFETYVGLSRLPIHEIWTVEDRAVELLLERGVMRRCQVHRDHIYVEGKLNADELRGSIKAARSDPIFSNVTLDEIHLLMLKAMVGRPECEECAKERGSVAKRIVEAIKSLFFR